MQLFCCFAFSSLTLALEQSAFKPGQVWNDVTGQRINAHGGCILFHQGIYYWYGEHKIEGLSETEHADGGVHCYASTDLLNWHDMGMMIRLDRPETEDLTHECNSDRPKVVYNDSTHEFVMFFKLYLRGMGSRVAFVGVATSQSPTGPFNYRHKFLGGNSPQGTGDFAMFKDDDGSLYHLTVRKPDKAFVIGKMRDDYLLPEGDYKVAEGVSRHTEAPALFKKDDEYFMLGSGSTGWAANAARSFSAPSIHGPWTAHGNPVSGINPNNGLGPDKTYGGQSNFIIEVEGLENAYIAMFDINKPDHPFASGYIWLPITLNGSKMSISWQDSWTLDVFNLARTQANSLQINLAGRPPDITVVEPFFKIPEISEGKPGAGKLVRQYLPEYEGTEVHHLLHLPENWEPGKTYPVIIEYNGNNSYVDQTRGSGYGISGGKDYIWAVLPFVNEDRKTETNWWWGKKEYTVEYAKKAVPLICKAWGGDVDRVVLTGHSRGAIACNYIGLHDDEIAQLWTAMVPISHYDGRTSWYWEMSEKDAKVSAPKRVKRLGDTPQLIVGEYHLRENHTDANDLKAVREGGYTDMEIAIREADLVPMSEIEGIREFIDTHYPEGNITFLDLPFVNHTNSFLFMDIPEREMIRRWLKEQLNLKN